ncbi:9515_t:CDS:1, partial [Scutellospora calospora]
MSLIESDDNYDSPVKSPTENLDMSHVESKNSTTTIDVVPEELRFMKESIEEQSAQIQIFEVECNNLIKELRNLQSQRIKLQNERTELNK